MKILFLATFLSSIYFTKAQLTSNKFFFAGKVTDENSGIVYLSYINSEDQQVKDSCFLKNGSFYFTGKIIEPTLAFFSGTIKSSADDDPNTTSIFLEQGKMTGIVEKGHFKEIKINGSKTQMENALLQKKYNAIDKNSDSAYEKFSQITYQFVSTHRNSYVSAFQLALYETRWPLDSVRILYNRLEPKIRESFYGKDVGKLISNVDNNSPGQIAKLFTATDITGNSLSLSDFKGKYVLLDFWASWCVPCRQGNPHLIKLFKKYHGQGFNIIGVSADDDIQAWKTAVQKDEVGIWHNILSEDKTNNNGETNENQSITKKFGVHVFPTKILIDKSGVIIGRYKGTEEEHELDEKLSEIFK